MQGDLGYLYLDLKSRKSKHPICAHFAIKGGRRISETEYQLPVSGLYSSFIVLSSKYYLTDMLGYLQMFVNLLIQFVNGFGLKF